jgi:hypothetical protein
LRELGVVFLDDLNALQRILEVVPDVVSPTNVSIVLKPIKLVVRQVVSVGHKADIMGHMKSLGEILDL